MVIGAARVTLHIPGARSLKDKRQIVKSILAQVQREYRLAAAEVDRQDDWQVAVLGLTCVSTSAAHADEILAHAVRFISSRHFDAVLADFETETIHAF
jgi:uncharacterized protein YlxP (DUF503 family)